MTNPNRNATAARVGNVFHGHFGRLLFVWEIYRCVRTVLMPIDTHKLQYGARYEIADGEGGNRLGRPHVACSQSASSREGPFQFTHTKVGVKSNHHGERPREAIDCHGLLYLLQEYPEGFCSHRSSAVSSADLCSRRKSSYVA